MENKELIGYISGGILFFNLFVYLRAIYKYKLPSNRITWGVWVFVQLLFCISYYKTVGLVDSIWVAVVYTVTTLVIFLFLLRYGKKGHWTWVEVTVLACIGPILLVWFVSKSALIVLTLTLAIDILGFIPLAIDAWKDPSVDYAPVWYISLFANSLNLFAVEHWDYANATYPLYLALMTLTMSILLSRRAIPIITTP